MAKSDELIRDQLGSITEGAEQIAFDKDASWSKLNSRLQPQRKKALLKPSYKWAAVAILFLATIAVLFNRPAEIEIAEATQPAPLPSSEIKNTVETPITMLKTNNIAIAQHKFRPTLLPQTTLPAIIDITDETTEIAAEHKPAMKVIHMNELAGREMFEKELKDARYVYRNDIPETGNNINEGNNDLELPEQFRNDNQLKH